MKPEKPTPGDEVTERYIEHLRHIHFLIVIIASTLLITAISIKDKQHEKTDLRNVSRIIQDWNPQILNEIINHTYTNVVDRSFLPILITSSAFVHPSITNLAPSYCEKLAIFKPPVILNLSGFPRDLLAENSTGYSIERPSTLSQFREIWNQFISSQSLVYPTVISTQLWIFQNTYPISNQWQLKFNHAVLLADDIIKSAPRIIRIQQYSGVLKPIERQFSVYTTTGTTTGSDRPRLLPEKTFSLRQTGTNIHVETELFQPNQTNYIYFNLSKPEEIALRLKISNGQIVTNLERYSYGSEFLSDQRVGVVPCETSVTQFRIIDGFRSLPDGLRPLPFDLAFENLANYLRNYPHLDKVPIGELESDLLRKSYEFSTIDILSLSIPRNILGVGGPVIISVLLLYFLIHFRQTLSISLFQNWLRIPYILFYPGWIGKAAAIITLGLLPLISEFCIMRMADFPLYAFPFLFLSVFFIMFIHVTFFKIHPK